MTAHHSVAVQFRMNKALVDWVEANYKLHGFNSRSELIRQAVRDFRERKIGSELPSIPEPEELVDVEEPEVLERPVVDPTILVAAPNTGNKPPASIEPQEPATAMDDTPTSTDRKVPIPLAKLAVEVEKPEEPDDEDDKDEKSVARLPTEEFLKMKRRNNKVLVAEE